MLDFVSSISGFQAATLFQWMRSRTLFANRCISYSQTTFPVPIKVGTQKKLRKAKQPRVCPPARLMRIMRIAALIALHFMRSETHKCLELILLLLHVKERHTMTMADMFQTISFQTRSTKCSMLGSCRSRNIEWKCLSSRDQQRQICQLTEQVSKCMELLQGLPTLRRRNYFIARFGDRLHDD